MGHVTGNVFGRACREWSLERVQYLRCVDVVYKGIEMCGVWMVFDERWCPLKSGRYFGPFQNPFKNRFPSSSKIQSFAKIKPSQSPLGLLHKIKHVLSAWQLANLIYNSKVITTSPQTTQQEKEFWDCKPKISAMLRKAHGWYRRAEYMRVPFGHKLAE